MLVGYWRRRCCALAAGVCLLSMTGCGANVVGPIARWRYQLSIQRPLRIEPENKGVPAPLVGDPAPCDPNRCLIRHTRSLRTLPPREPAGLPPHPNFHPVPVHPVFGPGPVTYGGSPVEEIHVIPGSLGPPVEELKQMPAPPSANPPEVPPDSQAHKGWYHPPMVTDDLQSNQAVPVSNEEIVEPPNASNVRFVER